jgi:hypothetical protein
MKVHTLSQASNSLSSNGTDTLDLLFSLFVGTRLLFTKQVDACCQLDDRKAKIVDGFTSWFHKNKSPTTGTFVMCVSVPKVAASLWFVQKFSKLKYKL